MILFSLTNISVICQELINDIFWNILDEYVIVYLDNILIYSNKILKDHIIKVKEIFGRFSNRRLLFKLEKCKFHQTEIEFLGYIVG